MKSTYVLSKAVWHIAIIICVGGKTPQELPLQGKHSCPLWKEIWKLEAALESFLPVLLFSKFSQTPEHTKVLLQTYHLYTDLYFSLCPFFMECLFLRWHLPKQSWEAITFCNWDLHIHQVKVNEKCHPVFLTFFLSFIHSL